MRIRVDQDRCQGHGRCYSLAPDQFESDDFGNAVETGDGLVPAGAEDRARLAAGNCPEHAVLVEES